MKSVAKILAMAFIIGLMINLSACVSLKVPKPQTTFNKIPPKTRQKILSSIKTWQSRGAFSFIYTYPRKRSVLANFSLQLYDPQNYDLEVTSALDLYTLLLQKQFEVVKLGTSRLKQYEGRSPEQLMQHKLGWSLPVSSMIYWLKGQFAPGKRQVRYDYWGHIIYLKQQGWVINYLQYTTVNMIDLPQLIMMQRPGYKLKIVIKRWAFTL